MAGKRDSNALRRPGSGFAMLAIDQRDSMRAMFAEKQTEIVTDDQLIAFKLAAIKALTPHASAVLMDREFAWTPAIRSGAVAAGCAKIAAADRFIASADEIVSAVEIDDQLDPVLVRQEGGLALKLLVTWRPDELPERRIAMVRTFIDKCRQADLLSIVEPVSRKRRDGQPTDLSAGILAAAAELGRLGADVYKAEVPLYAKGTEADVRAECARLNTLIDGPWVVLSSGVVPDQFPEAVSWACLEGASGFLAGRAVWRGVVGHSDLAGALERDAVPRLRRLCDVVDKYCRPPSS